jgi:hypothetical protein
MAHMTAEQKAEQRTKTEEFVQAQAPGLDPARLKKIVEMILAFLAMIKN